MRLEKCFLEVFETICDIAAKHTALVKTSMLDLQCLEQSFWTWNISSAKSWPALPSRHLYEVLSLCVWVIGNICTTLNKTLLKLGNLFVSTLMQTAPMHLCVHECILYLRSRLITRAVTLALTTKWWDIAGHRE